MNNSPKVSLIVPIFNVEKYILDCLESIVNQSYPNIEVICIDDGSKDNSLAIAENIAQSDPRVKIYCYENAGLSVARNRGIKKAEGEFIQFVDSDDILPQDSIKNVLELITKFDLDICFGDARTKFDGLTESDQEGRRYSYSRPAHLNNKVRSGPETFLSLINSTYHPSACLYVTKKESLEELSFYPNIYHEDNLFTTQLLLKKNIQRVMVSSLQLYIRRVRPESLTTQSTNSKHVEGLITVYEQLLNDYKSKRHLTKEQKKSLMIYLERMLLKASKTHQKAFRGCYFQQVKFRLFLFTKCLENPILLMKPKLVFRLLIKRSF